MTQMADIVGAAAGPAGKIMEKTIRFLNKPHLEVLDKLLEHHLSVVVSGRNNVDQPTP